MWQIATAKEPIVCEHCDHPVLKGHGCLTEVPELILENTPPKEYRHFHIRCQECQTDRSCYELFAAAKTPVAALIDTDCTHCGHTVHAGQALLWDYYFALDEEREDNHTQEAGPGFTGFLRRTKPSSFNDLSANIKNKFVNAGLGRGRGVRTPPEAAEFFRSSVPSAVRNLGEGAVSEFTNGKHASHIESFMNAPSKVKSIGNSIWEAAKNNRNRGSRNMTGAEQLGAHVKNGACTARIVAKSAAMNAGRAAGFAVILEAPVSVIENSIHVVKGNKSREQAAKDTAKNVGKAGIVGGVVGAGITVATAFGAAPILATAAPVVVPVGIGIFAFSAAQRIKHAAQEPERDNNSAPLPSDTLPLFFHAECQECGNNCSCYEQFAAEVSDDSQ